MQDKTLLLLTNYYPYFNGEEYLESEITYLSNEFDNIVIIPTMVNEKMSITRDTPKNVSVLKINYNLSIMNRFLFAVKRVQKWKDFQEKNADSFLKKIYLNYFENRANYVFKSILRSLDIDKFKNDHIYIYSYWFFITARVSILLKEFLKSREIVVKKIVSRAHRYDLYENESKLNYLPEREYLLKNIDYIYPCSLDGKDHLNDNYNGYEKKITEKYLGTEEAEVHSVTKSGKNLIVSCSGIRKVKRIEKIIDGLALLEKDGIEYSWIHFGGGKYFNKMKKYAQQELSENNFEFKGNISNQSLKKWYDKNNVDIFINLSISEGIPVSIMEAMARGIPVIATDVGGSSELIEGNGILLKKYCSSKDVSEAIVKIFHHKNYTDLCKNSICLWNEKFDSEKNYSLFAELLVKEFEYEI